MTTAKRRIKSVPDKPTGVHPAAEVWPLLPDDELQALAEDIKTNGLNQSVVLDGDGLVLDGRNRLAACELAGVQPVFMTYQGDPVPFILSANARRRHMSKGAIAMAAFSVSESGQAVVSELSGASMGSVGKSAVVKKWAPEMVDEVIAGRKSLDYAYDKARERKDARDKAAEQRATIAEHWPDLMPAIDRDEITAAEAIRVGRKRDAEKAKVAREDTERLAAAVFRLIGQLNGATMRVEVAAECVANLDAVPGIHREYFAPAGMRTAADNLARFADAFEAAQ